MSRDGAVHAFVDANVMLRLFTGKPVEQARAACDLMNRADSGDVKKRLFSSSGATRRSAMDTPSADSFAPSQRKKPLIWPAPLFPRAAGQGHGVSHEAPVKTGYGSSRRTDSQSKAWMMSFFSAIFALLFACP